MHHVLLLPTWSWWAKSFKVQHCLYHRWLKALRASKKLNKFCKFSNPFNWKSIALALEAAHPHTLKSRHWAYIKFIWQALQAVSSNGPDYGIVWVLGEASTSKKKKFVKRLRGRELTMMEEWRRKLETSKPIREKLSITQCLKARYGQVGREWRRRESENSEFLSCNRVWLEMETEL